MGGPGTPPLGPAGLLLLDMCLAFSWYVGTYTCLSLFLASAISHYLCGKYLSVVSLVEYCSLILVHNFQEGRSWSYMLLESCHVFSISLLLDPGIFCGRLSCHVVCCVLCVYVCVCDSYSQWHWDTALLSPEFLCRPSCVHMPAP